MQRPANYTTKHGKALLSYLASVSDTFVTAAQIAAQLQKQQIEISRPTVYRQLEKLVAAGQVRKYLFADSSVAVFQYAAQNDSAQSGCHLKCEVCEGVFNLQCNEIDHISQHILESHAFQVNDRQTVFYGRCKTCI